MSQTTNQLPAISTTPTPQIVAVSVNQLIKQNNRQDAFIPIYAADTGSATAYVMTPVPGIKFYRVGQIFSFKAANANTGTAPTLNVNGWGAGTITYPDGSALIAGDIAANGFYTVECTSTTPTFALVSAAGGRSKLLQTVSTETGGVATGTTVTPVDNTIPQNTEGDQYMSLTITPKSATSTLIIEVKALLSPSTGANLTASLFQDSTANALAASVASATTFQMYSVNFTHVMTSGTTSATTFKVRGGISTAGTLTFNGQNSTQVFGGVMASSIVIRESLP